MPQAKHFVIPPIVKSPIGISHKISILAQACLNPDPEQRPSCSGLLQFSYFEGVEASFSADFWAAQVIKMSMQC